ncbi:glycosyltransferase family 2 protein [candidate division WWE3 bacterium]|uniref:Glycosyltransferase family 2 protein n=1 Tax=candidate division WWE3 bacterium TaxID=2053526 RepID=A0A955EC22_UNCKA|nr:glycosyltransferase family 2 protein [candidate division WWE3 bacterium]
MITSIVDKHDSKFQRLFEIMPGLLTWTFMLSPIWLGLLYPEAAVYLLIFLAIYWVYLSAKFTLGLFLGYKKYTNEIAIDWLKACKELDFSTLPDKPTLPDSLDDTHHLLLIPAVNESKEILKGPIDAFLSQTYPLERIILCYSVEEKYYDMVKENILDLLGDNIKRFEKVLIEKHPAGIPGEAIGSGAGNRTWGAKKAKEYLEANNKPIKNYILTHFDADHVPHEQFLSRLAHLYLKTDRRNNHFYATSVHLFNNNHWEVPAMMRFEANFVTMGTLANRSIPWGIEPLTKDTFASYSSSFQTLIDADYFDVSVGVDDSVFFWRAFFVRDGDFKGASHYIPYSADAVLGTSYWNSYVSLYKQLLRWGWGVVVVPIAFKGFLTNKKVPLTTKLIWTIKHLKMRVIMVNISFLITFGFGILTLANPNVRLTTFNYSLPDIISIILSFALVFIIPGTIIRQKITTPMPKDWPVYKKLFAMLEGPLAIINLLTYSFVPFIEAQTRMLLGKKMKDLYHTPKVRANS